IERVLARVQRSAEAGELWEDTFPLRGKDGQYRWFLSRAVPIRDEQGNVVRWFGTNTDVTDLREAQAKLAEAHAQLGSRAEHLETLVRQRTAKLTETIGELEAYSYSIVHDMRAPLRSMQGFSNVLRSEFRDQLGAEGAGYLDRIGRSAE
ncbi:PAS domain-containing protein, partial [Bradyrhizobium sp. NBAIM08]|uniref:PAS domain-containing protein n=1 Tax=Bradyrhizobium sp. NBAIM08 TaxID=2793815 RepID=UPI001CD4D994